MNFDDNKLGERELSEVSGGNIIESDDNKFYLVDNVLSFDNQDDAIKYEQLSKQLTGLEDFAQRNQMEKYVQEKVDQIKKEFNDLINKQNKNIKK